MKKYNAIDMKGRLYDYTLEADTNTKGDLIKGTIQLEVDSEGTVITMKFFCNEKTNAGKLNKTYGVLESILAGNYQTVAADGDEASWLGLTGTIDVSYFKGKDSGPDDDLIRSQKLRGSFVNANTKKEYCNKWKLDCIITGVKDVEADLEKQTDRFVKVDGFLVDDYHERVMEVGVQARGEKAMDYIVSNVIPSVENPHFVSMWGEIKKISRLVVRKNAFGDDETDTYDNFIWNITGMNPEPYDIGEENVLGLSLYEELRSALADHKAEEMAKGDDDSGTPELAF